MIVGDAENQTLHSIEPAHGKPPGVCMRVGGGNVAGVTETLNATQGQGGSEGGRAMSGRDDYDPCRPMRRRVQMGFSLVSSIGQSI